MPPVDTPNQDIIPNQDLSPNPPVDEKPAWVDDLLGAVQSINERVTAFEQAQQPPEPIVEPQPEPNAYVPPKSWEELEERIDTKAEARAKALLDQRDADARAAAEAEQNNLDEVNKYLDKQIADLEQAQMIPKVEDPNNQDDAGRKARTELYGYAYSLGTTNLVSAANSLKALHDAGQRYDVQQGKIVREIAGGSTAPIAGGTPPVVAPGVPTPDTKFFASHSLDEVAEIAQRAIQ